jgi:hypothetical protein
MNKMNKNYIESFSVWNNHFKEAQLFSNSFEEGVLGVVRKSRVGSYIFVFYLGNGYSRANFASANFANVASTCASTRGHVCGTFCVDVVTRQTRRHSPSRVAQTHQTRERGVWRVLRKFGESGKSGKFGECRLDRFMQIKYVICA